MNYRHYIFLAAFPLLLIAPATTGVPNKVETGNNIPLARPILPFETNKTDLVIQALNDAQERQEAQKAEEARLAAVEAARVAEQARVAQVAAEAKKAAESAPKKATTPAYTPSTITQSDEFYRNYIFSREGGLSSRNAGGCIGLGQSCPQNGVPPLLGACPNWATDLPCQLAFWDRYAMGRYGSWKAAYEYKVRVGWW